MVSGHSIQECSVEVVSRLTLVHLTVDISLEARGPYACRCTDYNNLTPDWRSEVTVASSPFSLALSHDPQVLRVS